MEGFSDHYLITNSTNKIKSNVNIENPREKFDILSDFFLAFFNSSKLVIHSPPIPLSCACALTTLGNTQLIHRSSRLLPASWRISSYNFICYFLPSRFRNFNKPNLLYIESIVFFAQYLVFFLTRKIFSIILLKEYLF